MTAAMGRRRFLQIAAAAGLAGLPATAAPLWRGRGFGADLSLTLAGEGEARAVVEALPRLIRGIEAQFSLHEPQSALSRLNATGRLEMSESFAALVDRAGWLNRETDGAFDPTVQAMWLARQRGQDRAETGFHRLRRDGSLLSLAPGMALTFNGLAQGHAADAVRDLLRQHGFDRALVDMGEYAALGGPWHVGIADPARRILAERILTGGAIATSSPMATLIDGAPHLMHPRGLPPLWSTISVEADTATLADGLSTAAVFFDADGLQKLAERVPGLARITAIDFAGDLRSFVPPDRDAP